MHVHILDMSISENYVGWLLFNNKKVEVVIIINQRCGLSRVLTLNLQNLFFWTVFLRHLIKFLKVLNTFLCGFVKENQWN